MSHCLEENSVLEIAQHHLVDQFSEEIAEMNSKNCLQRKQIKLEEFSHFVPKEDFERTKFCNKHLGQCTFTINLAGDTDAIRDQDLSADTHCARKRN